MYILGENFLLSENGVLFWGYYLGSFLGVFRALGQREYKVIRQERFFGHRDGVNVDE